MPIRKCGKLVVCREEREMPALLKLYEQGLKNGVDLKLIGMEEARKMEPSLVGKGDKAIYSSSTSVMHTGKALQVLKHELQT